MGKKKEFKIEQKGEIRQDLNDRIVLLLKELDENPNSFAFKIGVKPAVIYHIVGGRRNKPGADVLTKICLAFANVNIRALLTGEGPLLSSKSESSKDDLIKALQETMQFKDYTIALQKDLIDELKNKRKK